MNRRRALAALAALGILLVLAGVGLVAVRLQPPPDRPHVVLVIGCTVRADQSPLWGGPDGTTPYLESMAARGALFERAVVQAPWTRPSVASLLTGVHPEQTGIVDMGDGRNDRVLPDENHTLAERMQAAGYRTLGVTANPNLNRIFGFDQGFDGYAELAGPWRDGVVKVEGPEVVRAAVRLVDRARWRLDRKPIFLQVVLVDAHLPSTLPYDETLDLDAPGLSNRVRNYRAMLRRFDAAVGDLDQALRARGMGPDEAWLVVIGDHGEGLRLPAHHGNAHGRFLYPSTVHVPWIVRGPGAAEGHRISGLAAGLDLVPTVLSLAGLPADPDLPGLDLSAQVEGASDRTGRDRACTSTWFQGVSRLALYGEEHFCQVDLDPDHTAEQAARRERQGKPPLPFDDACYDWEEDPEATVQAYAPELEAELARCREALVEAAEGWKDVEEAELDGETQKMLEELGYVE